MPSDGRILVFLASSTSSTIIERAPSPIKLSMLPYPDELIRQLHRMYAVPVNLSEFLEGQEASTSSSADFASTLEEASISSERPLEDLLTQDSEELVPERTQLQQCRLCGVILSPLVKDEIQRHLQAMHRQEFRDQFRAWLRERHRELNNLKKGQMTQHPAWKHFRRYSKSDAVCLLCLQPVRSACCSKLIKHIDAHHSELSRRIRDEWKEVCSDHRRFRRKHQQNQPSSP